MSPAPSKLVQIEIKAVSLGDAAGILHQRLPHVRCAWLDTLRDLYRCRSQRRTPGGHKLLPVARVRMQGGGQPRPLFGLVDLEKFIAEVSEATSVPAAPGGTPTTVTIRMPLCHLAGPWQMRHAEIAA